MIRLVDEALSQLLAQELGGYPGGVPSVSFALPDTGEAPPAGEVSLFLYGVRENLQRREEGRLVHSESRGGKANISHPPVYLELRYAVSVRADTPQEEHALFAAVLSALVQYRALDVISYLKSGPLKREADALPYRQPLSMQVAKGDLEPNAVQFWATLGCKPRPAVNLLVQVPIEPRPYDKEVDRVLQMEVQWSPDGPKYGEREVLHRVALAGSVVRAGKEGPVAVPGATVRLDGTPHRVQADGRGFYVFVNVPAGEYRVTAAADGFCSASEPVRVEYRGEGYYRHLNFRLRPAPLMGRVVLAPGEAGVAGVVVSADGREAVTDEDGQFAFDELPTGEHAVTAAAPGFLTGQAPGRVPEDVSGGGGRVVIPLQAAALAGRVLDRESRAGIVGAEVRVGGATAHTGEGGHFALTRLAPGRHRVITRAPGYRELEETVQLGEVANGRINLLFELAREEPPAGAPAARGRRRAP